MAKQHHVIYIPGIGDSRPWAQDKILRLWKLWNIGAHYSPVYWDINEPYEDKLAKLTKLVDKLYSQDNLVTIVGVSAGASMAMNVFAAQKAKISRAAFICGKLLYPETVQGSYFKKHPAFKESVFAADANFKTMSDEDKAKLLTLYPLADNTVPVEAAKLPGVLAKRLLTIGHIPAIYLAITVYSRTIAKFLKS